MKLWHLFFNREVRHEAIQPTDEPRECDVANTSIARLEALGQWDAAVEKACSTLAALHATPRATARVFVMPTRRLNLYETLLYWQSRGFRLKDDGRGFIEVVR